MVVIGVDAHTISHTLVAIDQLGSKLDERTIAATSTGHLQAWRGPPAGRSSRSALPWGLPASDPPLGGRYTARRPSGVGCHLADGRHAPLSSPLKSSPALPSLPSCSGAEHLRASAVRRHRPRAYLRPAWRWNSNRCGSFLGGTGAGRDQQRRRQRLPVEVGVADGVGRTHNDTYGGLHEGEPSRSGLQKPSTRAAIRPVPRLVPARARVDSANTPPQTGPRRQ